MERNEIEAAAKRAGLERLFDLFPDEIAAAVALVAEQQAALFAMPFDRDDAP